MLLLKCCTQYASKFGKYSSDHRTGIDWLSFQIPKKANVKECSNYHTISLISYSSKVMLKSSKLGFYSTWTENFWMYKQDLENAEEPEVKLPTSTESLKKQNNFRTTSTSVSLTLWMNLAVWITTNWKILRDGNARPPYMLPKKSLCRSRSNSMEKATAHGAMNWLKIEKGVQ